MKTLWLLVIGVVLTLILVGAFFWRTRREDRDDNSVAWLEETDQALNPCDRCQHSPCTCKSKTNFQNKEGKSPLAPLQEYKGKSKAVKVRTGHYIVTLKPTKDGVADIKAAAHTVNASAQVADTAVGAIYQYAFNGYSLSATADQITQIRQHPSVQSVEVDIVVDHCGGDEKGNDGKKGGGGGGRYTLPFKEHNVIPQPPPPRIMVDSDAPVYPASAPVVKAEDGTVPWGADQIGACLNPLNLCNGAGNVPDVHVYVVDTGISLTIPQLNVVENRSFVSGATSGADGNGHGTFVSSVLGAKDNSLNYVGVAPGVKLHAFQVLNSSGSGALSDVASGVEAVIIAKMASPATPMIINLSLGAYVGTTAYNALDNAILSAIQQNIHVVIAAGNSSIDARFFTPAHVTQAITVAAYSQNRRFASFSNWGPDIDFLAPGVNITGYSLTGTLTEGDGTSFSAPHVTGGLALLLEHQPLLTVSQAVTALTNAAKAKASTNIQVVPRTTTNRSIYIAAV